MLEMKSIINLSYNRAMYIRSREAIAQNLQKRMYGKTFFYSIPEFGNISGFCNVEFITYDRLVDTFIYVIKDHNTKHVYIIDRCNLYLTKVL